MVHLDEVILLGPILVEQPPGSRGRHEEDGLEGDLALGGEVDVRYGVIRILQWRGWMVTG